MRHYQTVGGDLIFCAVVGSNIHWQWTPNQYLASGIAACLAWIATQAIVGGEIAEALEMVKKMRPSVHGGGLKSNEEIQAPV